MMACIFTHHHFSKNDGFSQSMMSYHNVYLFSSSLFISYQLFLNSIFIPGLLPGYETFFKITSFLDRKWIFNQRTPTRKIGVHISPINKKFAKPSPSGSFLSLSYFLLFIGLPFTTAYSVLWLFLSFRSAPFNKERQSTC